MRLLGQMLSMGIAMLVFAVMIGPVEITPVYYPQFMTSMHIGFIVFAISCIVGIFFSMVRGTMHSAACTAGPILPLSPAPECEGIYQENCRDG